MRTGLLAIRLVVTAAIVTIGVSLAYALAYETSSLQESPPENPLPDVSSETIAFVTEPVTSHPSSQYRPAISANIVGWEDGRHRTYWDIYTKDLSTGVETPLVVWPKQQGSLSISGRFAAWGHEYHKYLAAGIVAKNLLSGDIKIVTTSGAGPAISGNLIAWSDDGVYVRNMKGGAATQVSPAPAPSVGISGNLMAWQEWQDDVLELHVKDLTHGIETIVDANMVEERFAISGNVLVWVEDNAGDWDIHMRDLLTGQQKPVVSETGAQREPAISGDTVAWSDDIGDIHMKNLSTGLIQTISTHPNFEEMPAISGSLVVWTRWDAPWIGPPPDIYLSALGPVSLALVPDSTTVAPGGDLELTAILYNHSSETERAESWAELIATGGRSRTISGPTSVSLAPKQVIAKKISRRIPATTPAGNYVLKAYVTSGSPTPFTGSDAFNFGVAP